MLPSLAFLLAALVLAVTPGPGIAYVVARTAAGGRAEGLASCVGTGLGGMFHVCAAALGLSLLLAQSAAAFSVVKYLGAAYLQARAGSPRTPAHTGCPVILALLRVGFT